MKKKIILICSILIVIVLISLFLINLSKDKKSTTNDIKVINDNYNLIKKEVEKYNSLRNQVSDVINEFYYEEIESIYISNNELLNSYTKIIDNITNYVKILDSKCNKLYSDVDKICNSYKNDYEIIVNVYLNDINNYNQKLTTYNKDKNRNLELFSSNYNYIDYDNDGKKEEKN